MKSPLQASYTNNLMDFKDTNTQALCTMHVVH
jgi:hypothetical protein